MKRRTISCVLGFTGIAAGALLKGYRAHADTAQAALHGTALVYRGIPDDQVEQLTTPARIASVVAQASDPSHVGAPSAIWQALEHGEKIDCLDCIPGGENLLYSDNNKNREIAASGLRRRRLGVVGTRQGH